MLSTSTIPPPPQPWNNQDYEDNIFDSDLEEETEDEHSEYSYGAGYESEDSIKSLKLNVKKSQQKHREPVPYYRSILQEEEYFSE